MYVIPSKENKKFSQPNTGDIGGNLWSTFNVNISKNKGRVLSTRTLAATRNTDEVTSTMKLPIAFAYFDYLNSGEPLFIAYGAKMFATTTPWTGWNAFGSTGEPNITTDKYADVDMKTFNGKLYATTTDISNHYLKRLSPIGAWTNIATIGSGDIADLHILEVYANRLYWTQDNYKIFSMNTAETTVTSGSYTLQLTGRNGHISWVKAGSNRIWIGWTSSDGSRGSVFEWDGQSENLYSKEYKIEAQGSCTCVIKNDIPYVLDVEGRLLEFNGSNFQEVARLPIANSDYPISNYIKNSGLKLTHFNGSLLLRDQMLFLVNPVLPRPVNRYLENCQAGIWEYTQESGLTHKYSVSSTKVGASVLEYGQQDLLEVGALFDGFTTNDTIEVTARQGQVLFGARSNQTGSPFIIGIDNTLDDVKKSTYFITQWLESSQVEEVWKSIVIKYRKFLETSDKIKVKYRTIKDDYSLIGYSWTSATTFTVLSSVFPNIVNYNIGDEVEIMNGIGAGKCVNITNVTNVGTTYTVTIDEAITSATGSGYGKFQHWIKLQEVQNNVQFATLPLPQYNKDIQIQFKIIMETTGESEIHETIVVSGSEQNAK